MTRPQAHDASALTSAASDQFAAIARHPHPAFRWTLALRRTRTRSLPDSSAGFHTLPLPHDVAWADPCVIARDGGHDIYFEELDPHSGRGWLSALRVEGDGRISAHRPIIVEPWHLSYPHVFFWQGELFLLPESWRGTDLMVYHAVQPPFHWKRDRVILPGMRGVDSTLLVHDGRWWLFTTPRGQRLRQDGDVVLFHARTPFGPWTPHPANPVIRNLDHGRMGGGFQRIHGELVRIAQCGYPGYGTSIRARAVRELSTTRYREEPYAWILPNLERGELGLHTYSRDGSLEAIDLRLDERGYRLHVRHHSNGEQELPDIGDRERDFFAGSMSR